MVISCFYNDWITAPLLAICYIYKVGFYELNQYRAVLIANYCFFSCSLNLMSLSLENYKVCSTMNYDVFISYSSKDQKIVEGLSAYLEQHKIRCFVAYRDIKKGEVWARAIVKALSDSRMMLVVFSDNFNQSEQVDREIELASEDHKPILTFRITEHQFEGVKKYYLKNLNWIDAFPNPKVQFGELKDAVMRLLDMKEPIVIQKEEAIALQKADEVNSLHSVEKSGIKFLSDIDCRVCIDDEKWLDVHEDKITFFQLPLGEYKVECYHSMYESVSQTCFLTVGCTSQIYKIVLKDLVVKEAIRIADEACNKKDYQLAFTNYQFAVNRNNVIAQFMLGNCYCGGYGTSQNYEKAFKLYRKAADQGHKIAQYNLGCCYYYGQGVSQNYEEAVNWYHKSAKQGDSNAQYNLGYCYYYGRGVSQNYEEAFNWYRKSAEQGNSKAQYNLGCCYDYGNGISQNYVEAVNWYRKSAEQGHGNAQFNLGYCYHYGKGISENYKEALKWYRAAAKQEDINAQTALKKLNESW